LQRKKGRAKKRRPKESPIHQRLFNLAHTSNRPFNELLQYFAIERFLYRFSLSTYKEQFVLAIGTERQQ
jgi:hypothetical protein